MLNSHNKLQIVLIKTKCSCENVKMQHFDKKHGILAKSWHLTKIMVSVIIYCPYCWLDSLQRHCTCAGQMMLFMNGFKLKRFYLDLLVSAFVGMHESSGCSGQAAAS